MNVFIGAALAIGLAWLGVIIWESLIAKKSLETMGKNPELSGFLTILTILGIALVESAAIYGLIIAFQIAWDTTGAITGAQAVAAGLAIGITWFGAWVWEGYLVTGAIDAIFRNPAMKTKIMISMILFLALVESAAIYGLVIAFNILG